MCVCSLWGKDWGRSLMMVVVHIEMNKVDLVYCLLLGLLICNMYSNEAVGGGFLLA